MSEDVIPRRNGQAVMMTLQQMEIKLSQMGVTIQALQSMSAQLLTRVQHMETELAVQQAARRGNGPTER